MSPMARMSRSPSLSTSTILQSENRWNSLSMVMLAENEPELLGYQTMLSPTFWRETETMSSKPSLLRSPMASVCGVCDEGAMVWGGENSPLPLPVKIRISLEANSVLWVIRMSWLLSLLMSWTRMSEGAAGFESRIVGSVNWAAARVLSPRVNDIASCLVCILDVIVCSVGKKVWLAEWPMQWSVRMEVLFGWCCFEELFDGGRGNRRVV